MSESENNELDIHEPAAFGQQLMLAREKAGLTIEEAARAMNLKQGIVEAIEVVYFAFQVGHGRIGIDIVRILFDRLFQFFLGNAQLIPFDVAKRQLHVQCGCLCQIRL